MMAAREKTMYAAYDEIEKMRHNAAFTEKLQQSIRDIEEGRGIVKTIDELKAMEG